MALVTFTSGQVLTAQDLNDSFDAVNVIKSINHDAVATAQATSSTSYTDLATVGPTVTVTTGTGALVLLRYRMTTSGSANLQYFMTVDISGASTVAAADSNALITTMGTGLAGASATVVLYVSGLTAGSNTFTAKYRNSSATSATYADRSIMVWPL